MPTIAVSRPAARTRGCADRRGCGWCCGRGSSRTRSCRRRRRGPGAVELLERHPPEVVALAADGQQPRRRRRRGVRLVNWSHFWRSVGERIADRRAARDHGAAAHRAPARSARRVARGMTHPGLARRPLSNSAIAIPTAERRDGDDRQARRRNGDLVRVTMPAPPSKRVERAQQPGRRDARRRRARGSPSRRGARGRGRAPARRRRRAPGRARSRGTGSGTRAPRHSVATASAPPRTGAATLCGGGDHERPDRQGEQQRGRVAVVDRAVETARQEQRDAVDHQPDQHVHGDRRRSRPRSPSRPPPASGATAAARTAASRCAAYRIIAVGGRERVAARSAHSIESIDHPASPQRTPRRTAPAAGHQAAEEGPAAATLAVQAAARPAPAGAAPRPAPVGVFPRPARAGPRRAGRAALVDQPRRAAGRPPPGRRY